MALLPDEATAADIPVVVPDAGPWITLAYADALALCSEISARCQSRKRCRCLRLAVQTAIILYKVKQV
jgi:hypothetical protein